MTPRTNSGKCVELRTAQESDLPAVLGLLGRAHLPTAGVADAPGVRSSIEFQEACPASATVMRKSLR